MFEVRGEARIMWFERVYVWLRFIERNLVYPLLFLAMVTDVSKLPLILFFNHFTNFCGVSRFWFWMQFIRSLQTIIGLPKAVDETRRLPSVDHHHHLQSEDVPKWLFRYSATTRCAHSHLFILQIRLQAFFDGTLEGKDLMIGSKLMMNTVNSWLINWWSKWKLFHSGSYVELLLGVDICVEGFWSGVEDAILHHLRRPLANYLGIRFSRFCSGTIMLNEFIGAYLLLTIVIEMNV